MPFHKEIALLSFDILFVSADSTSLFWLIREIAGRKNLGGGMLKAEAVDIKPFAILFDFPNLQEIKDLYEEACTVQVQNAQDEVSTPLHKKIDTIVFD